ncbi:ATP-dependent helicase [Patescibacteria group bacterium]|nr:ATP-dependent helicase [Patescibacteria group bacterium]
MKFTEEQKRIFRHDPAKHACILAGPGTGKSSTIISYICKVKEQFPEKNVRLLTFTRAANSELVDKIFESGKETIISSTVHSFAISVLLGNPGTSGLPEPIRIADDWEWDELIRKDLAAKLGISVSEIEKLKNEMSASWESLAEVQDEAIPQELRAKYMGLWEEHRKVFGYSLLSELPFRLKTALEGNSELDLGGLSLVAIDEYQDLNACDLNCFDHISKRGSTIIAIGDDDQSIYLFRKAHPEGIRKFSEDYKAEVYPLTISHRCGKKILNWANFVIGGDTTRASKPLLSASADNPEGIIDYLVFNRESSEAEGIIKLISWLINSQRIPYEEILILFRTKAISRIIKMDLKKSNIPFSDPDELLEILNQNQIRHFLAYLKLLVDKTDSLAWWSLLKMTKGIGIEAINAIYELAKKNNATFGATLLYQANTEFTDIKKFKNKLSALVQDVLKKLEKIEVPENSKWGTWVLEQAKEGLLPKPPQELKELLLKVDEAKLRNEGSLGQYINQIEPTIKDIMNSKIPGKLRIMSLSRSKGLTVRAVIIAGVEDGIIPHPNADCQEERRLLYVGMTRTREYLFLTRSRRRVGPSARSGRANVAGTRAICPFLVGGPVRESDGDSELKKLGKS